MYIGLTEKEFKTRYNGHKQSINNKKYKNSTTLSTYVWELKDKGINPALKLSILTHARPYSNVSKKCNLCLRKKYEILFYKNKEELLNKRSEIIAKCRHMNKFILANYKSKDWTQFFTFFNSSNYVIYKLIIWKFVKEYHSVVNMKLTVLNLVLFFFQNRIYLLWFTIEHSGRQLMLTLLYNEQYIILTL